MVDLVNSLKSPDLSPLFGILNMKRQDEQIAYDRERQNRLDELAMAEFNERVKQNKLDNQIRQQNAGTNQKIMESNLQNAELNRNNAQLEMRQLQQQLDAQQQELDRSRIRIAMSSIGGDIEAALGSVESGQAIPEELSGSLIENMEAISEMFSEGPFAQNVNNLKNGIMRVLETNDIDGWESVIGEAERLMKFAQPEVSPQDQLDIEYRQAQINNLNSQQQAREDNRAQEVEQQWM